MTVTTLVPIFGGNRMLAENVGKLAGAAKHIAIPCAGGFSEIPHFTNARTLVCNDLHKHIINLASVVADEDAAKLLHQSLDGVLFHQEELTAAQRFCRDLEASGKLPERPNVEWARNYFVCAWMTRSNSCGTPAEFKGGISIRWESQGGDSAVRFRSAVEGIREFCRMMKSRTTFVCMDALEFISSCQDRPENLIYMDPPFLGAGLKYTVNPGNDELKWNCNMVAALEVFRKTKIIVRQHDNPIVRAMYIGSKWQFHEFAGRNQANDVERELLIVSRR